MPTEHPFKFFIELTELNQIDHIKEKFIERADEDNYSVKEEWIKYIQFDAYGRGSEITEYFKDYARTVFKREYVISIQTLDSILLEEKSNKDAFKKLEVYASTWASIQPKLESDKQLKKYDIKQVTELITEYLESKKTNLLSKKSGSMLASRENAKLQWMGQINQLVTLFYDLRDKNTISGKPFLIETSKNALVDFIVDNFIDKDGNELSQSTVDTALKVGKSHKRASGTKRIDIEPYTQD